MKSYGAKAILKNAQSTVTSASKNIHEKQNSDNEGYSAP